MHEYTHNRDLSSIAPSKGPLSQRVGNNHLLVIGIDTYKYISKLNNAVMDAKALVDVLIKEYEFDQERVTELFNEQATREQIIATLDTLSDRLTQKDNLVIYFAGHGYYKPKNRLGFLVPVDGKIERFASMISNSEVKAYISGNHAYHIFLIIDSCFSGDFILRRGVDQVMSTSSEIYADRVIVYPSRWGLAAGRIEEVADGIAGNHSPFSKSLITFLKTITAQKFAVSELITHVCRMTTYNSDQTPIGGILHQTGHQGGEFVFTRKIKERNGFDVSNYDSSSSPLSYKNVESEETKLYKFTCEDIYTDSAIKNELIQSNIYIYCIEYGKEIWVDVSQISDSMRNFIFQVRADDIIKFDDIGNYSFEEKIKLDQSLEIDSNLSLYRFNLNGLSNIVDPIHKFKYQILCSDFESLIVLIYMIRRTENHTFLFFVK